MILVMNILIFKFLFMQLEKYTKQLSLKYTTVYAEIDLWTILALLNACPLLRR